jgi:SAM-dependent methyltransferase
MEPYFSDAREYYRDEYRLTHTEQRGHTVGPESDFDEPVEDRFKLQYRSATVSAKQFKETVPEGGTVLEIGCSAGGFLGHISKDYECYGLEWNPVDAQYVREVGEIPCEEGELIDAFPDKKFTAIVARQVFEHVVDPHQFLMDVRERLIGGGWLFMELPNANAALSAVYGLEQFQNWFYQAPHVTYWEPETLAHFLSAHGFEARIMPVQRWGLLHAAQWMLNGTGMAKRDYFIENPRPVNSNHPLSAALNRIWQRLDQEYRVQMSTLGCNDQHRVYARRREI